LGTFNPISQLLRAQIGQVNSLDRVQERVIGARLMAPVQVNVPRGRRGGSLIIEQDADYHGQVENLARSKGAPQPRAARVDADHHDLHGQQTCSAPSARWRSRTSSTTRLSADAGPDRPSSSAR